MPELMSNGYEINYFRFDRVGPDIQVRIAS